MDRYPTDLYMILVSQENKDRYPTDLYMILVSQENKDRYPTDLYMILISPAMGYCLRWRIRIDTLLTSV